MRQSRRIKRMSRNRLKITKMNLTSLMDVFTILVFFLLVNSGSVELVEAPKDVKLPESIEESKPRETVVVAVSPETIMVQGKVVALGSGILNKETGEYMPFTVSKGDRVIFSSYAGTEVKIGDDELLILSEDDVLGIIE